MGEKNGQKGARLLGNFFKGSGEGHFTNPIPVSKKLVDRERRREGIKGVGGGKLGSQPELL